VDYCDHAKQIGRKCKGRQLVLQEVAAAGLCPVHEGQRYDPHQSNMLPIPYHPMDDM